MKIQIEREPVVAPISRIVASGMNGTDLHFMRMPSGAISVGVGASRATFEWQDIAALADYLKEMTNG